MANPVDDDGDGDDDDEVSKTFLSMIHLILFFKLNPGDLHLVAGAGQQVPEATRAAGEVAASPARLHGAARPRHRPGPGRRLQRSVFPFFFLLFALSESLGDHQRIGHPRSSFDGQVWAWCSSAAAPRSRTGWRPNWSAR